MKIEVTPHNFDPRRQVIQSMDICPDMKLPAGKIYNIPRGIASVEQLLAKGATAISKYDLTHLSNARAVELMNQGISYDDASKTNEFLNLPDSGLNEWTGNYPLNINKKYFPNGPLTDEQGRQKGLTSDISHHVQVYETEEGDHFYGRYHSSWKPFFEEHRRRMRERFDSRGIKSYTAGTYLNLGWPTEYSLGNNRAVEKAMLTKTIGEMPVTEYSPGRNWGECNLITEAIYLGPADGNRKQILSSFYRLMIFRQMGKAGSIFIFGAHEWRPNNYAVTTYSGDKLYGQNKVAVTPNDLANFGFAGMTAGEGVIHWGNQGKSTKAKYRRGYAESFFVKLANGQFGNPNDFTAEDSKYWGYDGATDFVHFGVVAFNKTFGQTLGENPFFPQINVNGAGYRSGHVVDAYHDNQPMFYTEKRGNKLAWCCIDPLNQNKNKSIVWKDQNGTERQIVVSSNLVQCGIETL